MLNCWPSWMRGEFNDHFKCIANICCVFAPLLPLLKSGCLSRETPVYFCICVTKTLKCRFSFLFHLSIHSSYPIHFYWTCRCTFVLQHRCPAGKNVKTAWRCMEPYCGEWVCVALQSNFKACMWFLLSLSISFFQHNLCFLGELIFVMYAKWSPAKYSIWI